MNVGDRVRKVGGDYSFTGVLVAKFQKLSGAIRCVVENKDGVLHIYSEKNLVIDNSSPSTSVVDIVDLEELISWAKNKEPQ